MVQPYRICYYPNWGVILLAEDILQVATAVITIYLILPTMLARLGSIGVISRLPAKNAVAITFDDGPDPRYTNRVLDILKAAGIKASFFVVGEKASRHPDIIRRIVDEGHDIGVHGLRHRVPWLLGPLGTIREITGSTRAIEQITGFRPAVFRPPWGLLNLVSYLISFLHRQRVVLWSLMGWDWTARVTPDKIINRLRRHLDHGAILLLHDSDTEPGAAAGCTEKMLSALPGIIHELKECGYSILPLGNFIKNSSDHHARRPGRWFLKLWRGWDKLFRLALDIRDVTGEDGSPSIFRTAVRRYRGRPVELPGGKILLAGEKVCELHINNDYLAQCLGEETDPGRLGIKALGRLRLGLPVLAAHVSVDPRFKDISFVMGVTTLHRATAMLGFTAVDIPSPLRKKIISGYQGLVLNLYHPSGKGRHTGRGAMDSKILVIDKPALVSKYLPPSVFSKDMQGE